MVHLVQDGSLSYLPKDGGAAHLKSESLLIQVKACETKTLVLELSYAPPPSMVLNSCPTLSVLNYVLAGPRAVNIVAIWLLVSVCRLISDKFQFCLRYLDGVCWWFVYYLGLLKVFVWHDVVMNKCYFMARNWWCDLPATFGFQVAAAGHLAPRLLGFSY